MSYLTPPPGAALADAIEEQQRRQAERTLQGINAGRAQLGLPPLSSLNPPRVEPGTEPWSPSPRFWTKPGEGGE